MNSLKLRSTGRLLLSLLLLLGAAGGLSGCDSGGSSEAVGNAPLAPPPGQARPNPTLTVNLEPAVTAGVTNFDVIAYDIRGAEVARQRVGAGQNASFEDLPAGSVQIRVVGLSDTDEVVGFADVSAAVPGDTRVDSPALTPSDTVPPPGTPGTPFLAFTGLPASFEAGVTYTIEVGAFDAQGHLDSSANGSVGLSSAGVTAVMPSIGVLLNNGRAVFPSVVFPSGSNGTVTFTASAGGFQAAVSPTLPVRSN